MSAPIKKSTLNIALNLPVHEEQYRNFLKKLIGEISEENIPLSKELLALRLKGKIIGRSVYANLRKENGSYNHVVQKYSQQYAHKTKMYAAIADKYRDLQEEYEGKIAKLQEYVNEYATYYP